MSGADRDFEIPLTRPLAAPLAASALAAFVGAWALAHDHRRLVAFVFFALAAANLLLLLLLRQRPFRLRATAEALELPQARLLWGSVLAVRLSPRGDLIVETRRRKLIVRRAWLGSHSPTEMQASLEERLRRTQQAIGRQST
jgi:hypothetical protein